MAAPIAGYIQLPSDSGNTGKKVRTQTRVVGADTVQEHFFIPISLEKKLGLYIAAFSGVIQASAHTFTTGGFFWLQVPAGSTIKARIRRMNFQTNVGSSLSTPTAPRVAFTKFSFTGTASGAAQAPAKRDTNDASNVAQLRTAITGMTLTSLGDLFYALPPIAVGTAAWALCPPCQEELIPNDEDGYPVLRPGEGLACWQPDAGTTSDTRKFMVNLSWEECDIS